MRKKAFEPAYKSNVKVIALSPFFTEEAVAEKLLDWVATDHEARHFYGPTQLEAEKARANYHK